MKVVAFRRYYRSVRHYAVLDYSPIELLLKESRTSGSVRWQFVYSVYEFIIMTKPPVEHHDNMPDGDEAEGSEEVKKSLEALFFFVYLSNYFRLFSLLQPDQSSRSTKGRVKSSLNEIDDYNDDDSSDGDLNTKELLDKYASIKDSSADPDFEPSSDELSSENISEADTEEEKTESRKELNGKSK